MARYLEDWDVPTAKETIKTSASNQPKSTTVTTGTKPTAPYYDINKGMMVNPDGTPYVPPRATPAPSAPPATPENVGLVFGAGESDIVPEPKTPAELAGLQFGVGAGGITPEPKTPAELAGLQFGVGGPGVITGDGVPITTPPVSPEAGNAGLIFGAGGPGSITGTVIDTGADDTGGWPRYDINKGILVNPDGSAYTPGEDNLGIVDVKDETKDGTKDKTEGDTKDDTQDGTKDDTVIIDDETEVLVPEGSDVTIDPDTGEPTTQFVEYEYSKDFTKRRAKFFNSKTGEFTYGEWEDSPKTKEDFDKEQARIIAEETALNEKRDAFALIESTMRSYGFTEAELKEISDYIQAGILNPKLGSNQLVLQLRQLDAYKKRFAGNEQRRARGLNVLSEQQYLAQESDYAEYLRYYGQGKLANREQYATFIGNDIAPTELKGRLDVAVTRLNMANPEVIKQLKTYYPSINDADIVSYFLNPQDTLPELERKTTVAEIGAAAQSQGLTAGLNTAERLAQLGVTRQAAMAGYGQIASLLPEATKLSQIYGNVLDQYGQAEAEQETFDRLASAERKRRKLAEREIAAFSGQTGMTRQSLTSETKGQF